MSTQAYPLAPGARPAATHLAQQQQPGVVALVGEAVVGALRRHVGEVDPFTELENGVKRNTTAGVNMTEKTGEVERTSSDDDDADAGAVDQGEEAYHVSGDGGLGGGHAEPLTQDAHIVGESGAVPQQRLVVHLGEELFRLPLPFHRENVQDAHGVVAVGGGVRALEVAGDRLNMEDDTQLLNKHRIKRTEKHDRIHK